LLSFRDVIKYIVEDYAVSEQIAINVVKCF